MKFLSRLFQKKKITEKLVYEVPDLDCSSLILLSGPTYGDRTFFGSFLLNAVAVKAWTLEHSKSVWSSTHLEQQARKYLPNWLDKVNYGDDGYVTMIDLPMRRVLVPYTYDFYLKGWLSIYCHQCSKFHDTMIDNTHNHQKIGRTSKWTDEWLCPDGHILHYKEEEVRWIIKDSKKE